MEQNTEHVNVINCNMCGKKVKSSQGILKEEMFEAKKEWGFFSSKDTEIHSFNICEKCYDDLIKTFKIPIKIGEKFEIL